ncbi:MAG: SRPBCC family protein [Pseudomonadota bacterium]
MKFAHLVEINDPLNPLIDPLTRNQLWRGLKLRAEDPKMFVPHLDACDILSRAPDMMERELRYGELRIRDRVTFLPQLQIHYHVPAQKDIPASNLKMTIEEPQPGLLFVRFEYDSNAAGAAEGMDAFYDEFRCSAYQESDIDTIRMIRQLAAAGRLDSRID